MYFNEDHEALRSLVKRFVDREINPNLDEWEETTIPLHDLFSKIAELGLFGIRYDTRYGGMGLDDWFDTVFLEEIGHIQSMGAQASILVQTHLATPALHEFGSEYLKETYLKPAIAGKLVSALAITEPGAGSDVAALRTTAKKDGDSYIINGSKTFITNSLQADFLTLLARTSEGPGYHCFGLFVVPTDLPGFVVSKELDKLGWRCSNTCELFFDDLRIPAENLIGEPGEGFIYQMKQFQYERFSALPLAYVTARDIIDLTIDYIRQRKVFGKPLISRQVLRHRLVDWLTEIESLRQLTYHIVRMKIEKRDATKEISMGKLMAGRMLRRVADGCLQMFGGMGYMNENIITRYWRDVRLASIGAGADEVMSEIIAKLEGY